MKNPLDTASDREFWREQGGVGLVWSNLDPSNGIMITKALLRPNFHLLLGIAERFGLERLEAAWKELEEGVAKNGYREEQDAILRACPIVERCLRHMRAGA